MAFYNFDSGGLPYDISGIKFRGDSNPIGTDKARERYGLDYNDLEDVPYTYRSCYGNSVAVYRISDLEDAVQMKLQKRQAALKKLKMIKKKL